jgi:D-alanyl-D-alanine carboxypeptidase/D-alanyl-D-alanine-endopeptidase (penicillin-binding protein 4)
MVGRLRAKTGTLSNPPVEADPPAVKALAGYVDPREGAGPGTIEFVLIANTPEVTDEGIYQPLWAALGERFATYPTGPSPESLGPR